MAQDTNFEVFYDRSKYAYVGDVFLLMISNYGGAIE